MAVSLSAFEYNFSLCRAEIRLESMFKFGIRGALCMWLNTRTAQALRRIFTYQTTYIIPHESCESII